MSVYVDDCFISYGRMKMCHMMADTDEELHTMADMVGLKRQWFQPESKPHYDLCMSKRSEAIRQGAIPVTSKELITLLTAEEQE